MPPVADPWAKAVDCEVPALDGFLYMASVAKESWLKSHADLAVRYTRAVQKALNTIRDPAQTSKARDVIHQVYHPKIEKALFDATWAEHVAAYPENSPPATTPAASPCSPLSG